MMVPSWWLVSMKVPMPGMSLSSPAVTARESDDTAEVQRKTYKYNVQGDAKIFLCSCARQPTHSRFSLSVTAFTKLSKHFLYDSLPFLVSLWHKSTHHDNLPPRSQRRRTARRTPRPPGRGWGGRGLRPRPRSAPAAASSPQSLQRSNKSS